MVLVNMKLMYDFFFTMWFTFLITLLNYILCFGLLCNYALSTRYN